MSANEKGKSPERKSRIQFDIELDENRVPENMRWSASDAGIKNKETRSIMLSVWDPHTSETLRIDLWTKDMLVDDMKKFIHQTILSLKDTLDRSTSDEDLVKDMEAFADHFGDKLREENG